MIEKMDPSFSEEIHSSVTYVLAEIIARSVKENNDYDETTLVYEVVKVETIDSFISNLFKFSNTSVILEGIALLSVILETFFNLMAQKKLKEILPPIKAVLSKIVDLVKILKNPKKIESLTTTFGHLDPPLGEHRLKIIEFVVQLYRINSSDVEAVLLESDFISIILDLVLTYEFHNLLHNLFLSLITFILAGESIALKKSLFEDNKICEFIMHGFDELKDSKHGKGFIGHFIVISNNITQACNSQALISDFCKDVNGWDNFLKNYNKWKKNKLENIELGGPTAEDFNDQDNDNRPHMNNSSNNNNNKGGIEFEEDDEEFEEDEYNINDEDSDSDDSDGETMIKNEKNDEEDE